MAIKKEKRRVFVLRLLLIIIICFFSYSFISTCTLIIKKYKERDVLQKQLEVLVKNEKNLNIEYEKLQDPDYVARYAREKYLYSKDGEILIRISE